MPSVSEIKQSYYKQELSNKLIFCLFFLIAFIFFLPYFIHNKVLIASTDNYYYIFPNLIMGQSYWLEGNFLPWNRYLMGGVDFSSSNYNFMYAPIYWLLFSFPEKFFFDGFSLICFFMQGLTGCFTYMFLTEETNSKKWSLLGAVVLQIGGYAIFAMNMFPFYFGYFFATWALYIIWTSYRHSSVFTYVFLVFCFVNIIFGCHIIRSFMLMLMLVLFAVYRYWPAEIARDSWKKNTVVWVTALVTSMLFGAFRLIPLISDRGGSDRIVEKSLLWLLTLGKNNFYYLLNMGVPEVFPFKFFGYNYLTFMSSPPYAFSLEYLGVIPALLTIYGIMHIRGRQVFWTIVLLLSICFCLAIRPVADVLYYFIYPNYHAFLLKIVLVFPFVVVIALGGKALEKNIQKRQSYKWLMVTGLLFICFSFSGFAASLTVLTQVSYKILFLVIIISLGVFIIYGNKIHQYVFNNSKIEICFYTIVPLSLLTIILGIYTSKGNTLSGNSEYILAHLLACIFGSAIILLSSKFLKLKGWNSFLVFLVPVLFAVGLCILFDQGLSTKCSDNERILILFTGFIRSFFILISFIFMLFAVKSKRMTIKPFFIVLLAITFIDIFSFSRINMNNVCNAFWYKDQLQYPNKLESFYDELTGKYSDPVFDGINFCNNGNMEIWAGNKPADWNLNLVQTERTRGRYKSKSAVSISASHNWSNIYQDVTIPSSKTRKISFGAWVKTIDSKNIRLALGDYQKLVLSVPNSGSNDWEWMEINTMSNPVNGQIKVRPHIMTDNKTNFSVDGVVITMDGIATPFIDQEMDISREEFVKKMNIKTPPKIDLENYRLPQATAFLGIGAKWTYTHIPNVYKIPSLVGVNGFRPKSFLDLYFAFKPKDDPTPGNGGHFEYVSSERFLDLFCFGYDMDEERNILRRDTSLSRFMLYRNFEVVPEGEPTVKRLQNKDFKIWEKLIFNKDLEDFNAHNQKAVKLNYQTRQNDNYLELSVDCGDQPGIVYFSENYDLGWRAAVNGKPVDIRRANHNFMAVVVPSGKNHVVISFIPADFGLRISFVLAGSIFFMVAIFLFWRGNKKLKMAYSYLLIN